MSDHPTVRVRGVAFDIGDVLFDVTAWRRWLTAQLQHQGVELNYPQLVRDWEAQLVDVYAGRASYWDRFDALLDGYGLVAAKRRELTEQARAKGKAVLVERKPFDGVPETLDALRDRGLKLVTLSDTESGQAKTRAMLARFDLERRFDAVVCSVDIGHVKPEPEAYAAAAGAVGLDVRQCAFVGHDAEELQGAQDAGMPAIAFNYDHDVPADVRIERFAELRDVLAPAEAS